VAFPQSPLDVAVELSIDGIWTDNTSDVYLRNLITITRGRQDEASAVDPGSCSLTLNNRAGKYSPRNPRSPYFGKIGRNTPIRVSVNEGTPFLELPGGSTDEASTPDTAALDIAGDIDIRVDATLSNWTTYTQSTTTQLVGKFAFADGTKSWFFGTRDEALFFEWSADGSATVSASSTVPLPLTPSGRIAVRVTLDADNGSAGRTIRFYTAVSGTSGPWTQLGDDVVQAGVTSIFNSAVALRVGRATDVKFTHPRGRCHAVEIRSGIDGTVVANPDFGAQTVGAASFTDGAGRVWTMNGNTSIANRRVRFVGEVSSWPTRWDVSGKDVWVPIEAAGILRRLGQGAKALDSTLRRSIPSHEPLAYWPMEEGEKASQASSPIAGVAPLSLSRVNWASVSSLASSRALPALASSGSDLPMMHGKVPAPAETLTSWSVRWVYRLDSIPTSLRTFMRIRSTGTVTDWYIQQQDSLSRIFGRNSEGVTVFTLDVATANNLFNEWIYVRVTATQNGGNVDWGLAWFNIGGDAGGTSGSYAGTVGRPTGLASPPDGYSSLLDGMALGHLSAWPSYTTLAYEGAVDAWAGETAGDRMARLASEETLPLTVLGDASEQVGAQGPDLLLALLQEVADVDGGILHEQRESVGLNYRDRGSLYNQPVTLALDYTTPGHVAPPLEPVDDDQQLRNDFTVTRDGGSSARAVLEDGPLSVQAPPDGVGVYDESVDLNLYADSQPEPIAYWRLHLGTWDEARYPTVRVDLAAAPSLIDAATTLDSGDRLTIANPPEWQPPGPIDLLVSGYKEILGAYDWDITYSCAPAGPWIVGVADSEVARADTDGSTLAANATSTGTSLSVASGWYEDFEDADYAVAISGTWTRTNSEAHAGTWCLRSAVITHNETTDAVVTVPAGARSVQFWYRVSSESGWDFFRFLIDGVQQLEASGEGVWTQSAVFDVTGATELTFRYVKDPSTTAGLDAAFIDDLSFVVGPVWTTDVAEAPFDVRVGGEVMTVTAVTGTTSPQVFTVTRSANGIVKAHSAGADVRLAQPAYVAL